MNSNKVRSGDEDADEELECSTSSSVGEHVDHCYFAWFIMYLQGVGALFPWNAFITPVDYFQLRFQDSPFESSFESIFTSTFTFIGLITIVALQWGQDHVSLRTRIAGSLTLLFFIFLLVTILAVVPLFQADDSFSSSLSDGASVQFVVLLLCVGVSGMAVAVLTGSIMSYSTIFGSGAYIQAVIGGQGIAGLTVALGNMLRTIPSVANDCAADAAAQSAAEHDREVVLGAAVYFGASCLILLLCLLSFLKCERLDFTRACLKQVAAASPPSPVIPTEPMDVDPNRFTPQRDAISSRSSNHSSAALPLLDPTASVHDDAAAMSPYTALSTPRTAPPLGATLWKWCASMTLIYSITIALFPSLTAGIESVGDGTPGHPDCLWANTKDGLFTPFLFVMFNLGDTIGRNLPPKLSSINVILGLVACRIIFVPLFVLCKSEYEPSGLFSGSDAWPIIIMLVFAVSNGWLTTCIFVHSATAVSPHLRQRAGTFIVLFLNTGLMCGSLLSFFTRWIVCQCNPFLQAFNATSS